MSLITLCHVAALRELDLEADWDPDAHDRQMADLYGQDADELDDDDGKPMWDDDIDIGDIQIDEDDDEPSSKKKKKKSKKKKGKGDEEMDQGGVDIDDMDADVGMQYGDGDGDDAGDAEEWDGTEEMRKKVLDKYMNELYEMEFNDLVRHKATIFTAVQPLIYFTSL